jgi:CBS domain-containing protein
MLDPMTARVRSIMTSDVHTVSLGAPIREAARTLLGLRISGLPVVDARGAPAGVLSLRDILRAVAPAHGHAADAPTVYYGALAPEELRTMLADIDVEGLDGEVQTHMTPSVIACRADDSVREAARIMASRGIHRVLVVDESQRLAGVVSAMDVVGFVAHG